MRHRRIFYKVQSSEFKVQIVLRAMRQRIAACSEPTVLVRPSRTNTGLNKKTPKRVFFYLIWWPWSDCNSHPKSNQSRMLLVILVGPFHCAAKELPLVPNRRFSSEGAKIKTTKMVVYIFGGPGRTRTDTPCRT